MGIKILQAIRSTYNPMNCVSTKWKSMRWENADENDNETFAPEISYVSHGFNRNYDNVFVNCNIILKFVY